MGIMPQKTNDNGFERKNAFLWEIELAISFNNFLSLTVNYDQSSTQTRNYKEQKYYTENIKGFALGLRYYPFRTRLRPFIELQGFSYGTKTPDKEITNPERINFFPYMLGVNFVIGAKYMIIKQLDAFSKAKFNSYFNAITLGFNFNFSSLDTK